MARKASRHRAEENYRSVSAALKVAKRWMKLGTTRHLDRAGCPTKLSN